MKVVLSSDVALTLWMHRTVSEAKLKSSAMIGSALGTSAMIGSALDKSPA
jgi:hypothetical protein